jgi:hypothetical protein
MDRRSFIGSVVALLVSTQVSSPIAEGLPVAKPGPPFEEFTDEEIAELESYGVFF